MPHSRYGSKPTNTNHLDGKIFEPPEAKCRHDAVNFGLLVCAALSIVAAALIAADMIWGK